MARRILLIANPAAGGGSRRSIERAGAYLRQRGCSVEVFFTQARGEAERAAARAHPSAFDLVIAAGGDGTLNEVVNGLVPSAIPLAFLPLGTTNVFALETGISADIIDACDTALEGRPVPISLGKAGERRFLLMAGAGYDGRVVLHASLRLKRWAGKFAYVISGLINIARYTYPEIEVVWEDGNRCRAYGAVIGNARFYGGRYYLTPNASLASASLEVFLLQKKGRLALLQCIRHVIRRGSIPPELGRLVQTRSLTLRGDSVPVQVDGDYLCSLPMTFGVTFGEIRMIFPPQTAVPRRRPDDEHNLFRQNHHREPGEAPAP